MRHIGERAVGREQSRRAPNIFVGRDVDEDNDPVQPRPRRLRECAAQYTQKRVILEDAGVGLLAQLLGLANTFIDCALVPLDDITQVVDFGHETRQRRLCHRRDLLDGDAEDCDAVIDRLRERDFLIACRRPP